MRIGGLGPLAPSSYAYVLTDHPFI